jgi:hypothetical protein
VVAIARLLEPPSGRIHPVIARRVGLVVTIALIVASCGAAREDAGGPLGPAEAAPEVPTSVPATSAPTASSTTSTTVEPPTTTTTAPPRIRCPSVVHLGDSTSQGMVAPTYQSVPDGIDAQYARVGVAERHLEIDPARSIIETHHGSPNARDRAAFWRDRGYRGCWVFAMGTTDAANSGAGSTYDATNRIDRLMAVAGTDPVLWVSVTTRVNDGPWSNANMQFWNQALAAAATRYPNMRVFDWNALAQDGWFQSDGIHYSTAGSAVRARMIADALAEGFTPVA